MTLTELRTALDGLGFSARHRFLVELARDNDVRQLVEVLRIGDAHDAAIALVLADCADLPETIAKLIEHRAHGIRKGAAKRLARRGLPVDIDRLDPATRGEWLLQVSWLGQPDLADALLVDVRNRYGDRQAARILRACSDAVVRHELPELAHAFSSWNRLATRHPDPLLDHIRAAFQDALPSQIQSIWARFRTAWPTIARLRREALCSLVDDFAADTALPPVPLNALGEDRVRHLVLRESMAPIVAASGVPGEVVRRLRGWPEEEVTGLLLAVGRRNPWSIIESLKRLPPTMRGRVFDAIAPHLAKTPWSADLLPWLPHEVRTREAARLLELRDVQTNIYALTRVLVGVDPEVAGPRLVELGRAADAGERGLARVAQIANAACYRRGFAESLENLAPLLRNEQDPVRVQAVGALAKVPTPLWTAATLELAQGVIHDALEARDCSSTTRYAIQNLASRWLQMGAPRPEDPHLQAGVDTLRRLVDQVGQLHLPQLDRLPRGAEHHVIAALRPLIEAANAREQYRLVLTLCRSLKTRAHDSDFLQKLLEQAVFSDLAWVAKPALDLWLSDHRTRDVRVRKVLDKDPSMAMQPRVFKHMHFRRQEWLDPFLTPTKVSGVFTTGRTLHLPAVSGGFQRWLPRQQRAYANGLSAFINDSGQPIKSRVQVLGALARVPSVGLDTLQPWLESDDISLLEAALGATIWTAAPNEAVPILAQHLNGDRARVAMYALQRSARFLDAHALSSCLSLILRDARKVTVVKETLRLLGRFRVDGAPTLLRATLEDPACHRDIRIAALSGLRDFLDADGVFEAARTAAEGEPDLVRALFVPPESLARRHRADWFEILLPLFAHADGTVRQAAFANGTSWLPHFPEPTANAAVRCISDLSTGPEWKTAKQMLLRAARDGMVQANFLRTVRALSDSHQANAESDRDRPASQRRNALVMELCSSPAHQQPQIRALIGDIAAAVESDESAQHLALYASIYATEANDAVAVLADQAIQIADEPHRLTAWSAVVAGWMARTPDTVDETARALATHEVWAARLLAVTLLDQGAAGTWTEEQRALLRQLRSDTDRRVRIRALGVYTAVE